MLSEFAIQNTLHQFRMDLNDILCVPNCRCFGWEADFLSINKKLFLSEYEIKISRADFKAEVKKRFKHRVLGYKNSKRKIRPNYFYYVTLEGLVKESEIPVYAGLVYVVETLFAPPRIEIVKRAPLLCKETIDQKLVLKLAKAMSYRYWRTRTEIEDAFDITECS